MLIISITRIFDQDGDTARQLSQRGEGVFWGRRLTTLNYEMPAEMFAKAVALTG
jgi:hypothetical protein